MGQTAVSPKFLPGSGGPPIPFPVPVRAVRRLRRWRDRWFREGRLDLALQAAREVARREPGRESLLKLGFLLRESGRCREALQALRNALQFKDGPRYLVPEIHLHIAHAWFLLGRRKRMLRALRRAGECRPKPRSDGKFHVVYGNDLFGRGRWREAAEAYARAEDFARGPQERGRAAVNRGLALLRLGELEEAGRCLARAIRVLRKAGHGMELAEARMSLAGVRFDQGQIRRALGMCLRAAEAFRRGGKKDREGEALANAGYAAGEVGLWADSRNLFNRAIRVSVEIGRKDLLVASFAGRAAARAHLGDFGGAGEDLERARAALSGRRFRLGVLHYCRARARIAALRGDWIEVRRSARRAERVAGRAGDVRRVIEFRRMRARAEEELGRRRASLHARRTAERLAGLQANPSPRWRGLERQAALLAKTELRVLIVGECPRGRLEIARRVHEAGRRARGPFVVVPCDQLAFPAAEIYGREAGMWTGADRPSAGFAARARGGTLVLDRVDELPAADQRVLVPLADGRVRRVGGTSEGPLEARLLATCRDPEKIVPDLRRRLSGAVLELPAPGADGADTARLVERYLGGRSRITPDALAELAGRRWEGGPAELRAAVDRLVAFSGPTIGRRLVRRVLAVTETCRVEGRVHRKRRSRQMAAAPA